MDRQQLDTFIATQKQIHDFCVQVLLTLERDYPDVLCGEDNVLDGFLFAFDDLEITYYNANGGDSIYLPVEFLLSGDVEGGCEHCAREKRELDKMIDEELGVDKQEINSPDPYAN